MNAPISTSGAKKGKDILSKSGQFNIHKISPGIRVLLFNSPFSCRFISKLHINVMKWGIFSRMLIRPGDKYHLVRLETDQQPNVCFDRGPTWIRGRLVALPYTSWSDPDTVSDSGPILMHVGLNISYNGEWKKKKNQYQDQSMGLFYSIQLFIIWHNCMVL